MGNSCASGHAGQIRAGVIRYGNNLPVMKAKHEEELISVFS